MRGYRKHKLLVFRFTWVTGRQLKTVPKMSLIPPFVFSAGQVSLFWVFM